MQRRWAVGVCLALLGVAAVGGSSARAVARERPNVLVILSDDQGWGDLSINGNTNLSTPNIDSIGRSGAVLERFYVCPVCSPTRAEFLTGRYHPRGGVRDVSTGGERLDLDERTLAQLFRTAGYRTGAFGKWHNGTQWPYHPNARGFEEYFGFTSGHWGDYFSPPLDHNGRPATGRGFLADDLTERAMRFMERRRSEPFLCYVPFNTPHSPMQVPEKFWKRFADRPLSLRADAANPENLDFTRAALAMCENLDWNVGRLLRKLDELNLSENTVVLYFSDNGPNAFRWNGGMKGRKGSVDEGGVRSPFLIRWPGRIRSGLRVPEIAGAIDLLPTLCSIAGVPVPSDRSLDGTDLSPLLLGRPDGGGWPDRRIFSHWAGRVGVRTQRYRLDATGALFDLLRDPGQRRDVSAVYPGVARELREAVAAWRAEMLPQLGPDPRPFTVGDHRFPLTQLPARDGRAVGGIRRSANAPNCSYFTNWTSPADRITWNVEVLTAGTYEAEVLYACPSENVGCTVRLSLGDRSVERTVDQPHDPPLRGAENDRVRRAGESYVKAFRPYRLGRIRLPAGTGPLTLSAPHIPGRGAIEVRGLQLTLKSSGSAE